MLGRAALGVVRMSVAAHPHHRPLDLLGRPAGPGARARPRGRGDHRRRPRTPTIELERTEYVHVSAPSTRCCAGSSRRPRSTPWSTRGWSSTRSSTAPRVAHENNVIGTMNILAACGGPGLAGAQGRLQVLGATTTAASRTTRRSSPRRCAARTRRARRSSATSSRPSARCSDFAERNPRRDRHRAALRQRPRARPAHDATRAASACPRSRRSSASTRATSSSTRTTSSAASSTPSATTCPGVYNCAGDGVLVLSEVADLLGKPLAPVLPPWGTGLAAGALAPRRHAHPARDARRSCASAAALDNRRLKATGYRFRYTTRETVQALRRAPAARAAARRRRRGAYRYEREVEEFLRCSPSVRPTAPGGREPRRRANVAPGDRRAPGPPGHRSTPWPPRRSSRCCRRSSRWRLRRSRSTSASDRGAGRTSWGDSRLAGLRVARVPARLRCSVDLTARAHESFILVAAFLAALVVSAGPSTPTTTPRATRSPRASRSPASTSAG